MSASYSFLDVQGAIFGPGGAFSLGSGSGADKEGITIDSSEEIDKLDIGADSTPMHSLIANKSAKVTVRLLKTSPVNALLSQMVAFQRTSGANWGQNTLTFANNVTGDSIVCQNVAFAKIPNLKYAAEAGMNEWEFNVGILDQALGSN